MSNLTFRHPLQADDVKRLGTIVTFAPEKQKKLGYSRACNVRDRKYNERKKTELIGLQLTETEEEEEEEEEEEIS
jgi:hypothetical protein